MSYIKGDICTCIVPYESGQSSKPRPIVFWDDWELSRERPTVLVIPITSILSKQRYQPTLLIKRSAVNNLSEDSVLKIYQFSCISKSNMGRVIGRLTESEIRTATELIKGSFPHIY